MSYIKVKDSNNLIRDLDSNAIISTDLNAYDQYVENYKRIHNSNKKLSDIENDVHKIKSDLNDIKQLLLKITDGPKWNNFR